MMTALAENDLLVAVDVPVSGRPGTGVREVLAPGIPLRSHRRRRPDHGDAAAMHAAVVALGGLTAARASCGRRGKGHHWTNAVTQTRLRTRPLR